MAKRRYDRRRLVQSLKGLAGKDELTVHLIADDLPDDWGQTIHDRLAYVQRQCITGERPDLSAFTGLALTDNTPADDFRWRLYRYAHHQMSEVPLIIPLQPTGSSLLVTALQFISDGRAPHVRLNMAVRGVFWGMARTDWLDVGWELPADERSTASHITILTGQIGGQLAAMVFWNAAPSIVRSETAQGLLRKMDRSIGVPGVRMRWDRVRKSINPEEIRSAYWEAHQEGVHPDTVGSYILDRLDDRRQQPVLESQLRGNQRLEDLAIAETFPGSADADSPTADLFDAIGRLPPAQAEAMSLWLRAQDEGYTLAELCQEKGLNYKAVARNFQRAKKVLKLLLS